MLYLEILQDEIDIAQRKLMAAHYDIGKVRAAIRKTGFPVTGNTSQSGEDSA
jgi:hypothetical protein